MTQPNIPNFFDSFATSVPTDLMTTQLAADQLELASGVFTTTDPIIPDTTVAYRLRHLDPDIYDLRDSSHLMKLMKVLLGGNGAGALRKQTAVARMQSMLSGTHFLDLDHFYGALFGLRRASVEVYDDTAFDPYRGSADSATWDEIQAKDSAYRDRIVKFAKGIGLGATYVGVKAMVEAITGSDCEIYESWSWVDDSNNLTMVPVSTYTYGGLALTVDNWAALEARPWNAWGGGLNLFASRTGQKTRSDFVIQVKGDLSEADKYEITRIMNVFKPLGTQFTVNNQGAAIHQTADIRSVSASSEYWEVISRTTPNPALKKSVSAFYNTQAETQARPAHSRYQGEGWSYNGEVIAVNSYLLGEGPAPLTSSDNEVVAFGDGTSRTYVAADGVMTSAQAHSIRLSDDAILTSNSYAPSRGSAAVPLPTVGVTP